MPLGTRPPSLSAYLELIHPDDRDRVRAAIDGAFDSGVYDAEYRIRLPDGQVRWTHSAARVFHDADHRPLRMIGIGSDITDRRAVEAEKERLAEQERRAAELGQAFIGVVSHELRTPITMILGGAQLLKRMEKPNDGARRRELTADIEAEAERLYRLTEDLLVLTRVERGGLDIGTEPVLLRRILERVIRSESKRWPEVRIVLNADLDLPVVGGDATYVEQLARNLVANAAKYGGPGSEIQIVATWNDAEVEIRVLDDGPGLADADLKKVFELFYRSPITAKKAPGAGIGLFVAAHLASAMGGRTWATNREGGGSEFGFAMRRYVGEPVAEGDFPLASASQPAVSATRQAEAVAARASRNGSADSHGHVPDERADTAASKSAIAGAATR
jgi:signal transduction histidine kinase